MIDIMEELDTSNNLLQSALNRYLSACSALQDCYTRRSGGRNPQDLSHRVTEELTRIDLHEMRIKEAKVALNLSRNCCADIVPINVLPDEILGRVFCLVLDAEPCTLPDDDGSQSIYLKHINILSHVCSRWRQISISLGTLWSHIDIDLGSGKKSLARAVVYATRAVHYPLEVHIVDTGPACNQAEHGVAPFLSSIGPRVKSLQLRSSCASNESYPSILRACLASCVPGVLTWLVLGRGPGDYRFFEAAEDPQIPGSLLIDLPKQHFEDLWHHIQVLQLYIFCPPWTSKAYYGLTKLRLLSEGSGSEICIPEQQLVEILRSSPQLRVLFFDANITDPLPPDVPLVPVHLECLEALAWKSLAGRPNQLGTFLRLIAPGLKSLRVSIDGFDKVGSVWLDEIKRFFARSTVATLRMKPMKSYSGRMSADLFDLLPPLEVLTLESYHVPVAKPYSPPDHPTNEFHAPPKHFSCFETLRLLRCLTHVDELQRIIKTHSVRMLTVQRGNIISGSDEPYSYWKNSMSKEKINERLRDICPVAKFKREEDPRLAYEWDADAFDLV